MYSIQMRARLEKKRCSKNCFKCIRPHCDCWVVADSACQQKSRQGFPAGRPPAPTPGSRDHPCTHGECVSDDRSVAQSRTSADRCAPGHRGTRCRHVPAASGWPSPLSLGPSSAGCLLGSCTSRMPCGELGAGGRPFLVKTTGRMIGPTCASCRREQSGG